MFIQLTQQAGDKRLPTYVNTDNIATMTRHTDKDGSTYTLITFAGGGATCVDDEPESIVRNIDTRRENELRYMRPTNDR